MIIFVKVRLHQYETSATAATALWLLGDLQDSRRRRQRRHLRPRVRRLRKNKQGKRRQPHQNMHHKQHNDRHHQQKEQQRRYEMPNMENTVMQMQIQEPLLPPSPARSERRQAPEHPHRGRSRLAPGRKHGTSKLKQQTTAQQRSNDHSHCQDSNGNKQPGTSKAPSAEVRRQHTMNTDEQRLTTSKCN